MDRVKHFLCLQNKQYKFTKVERVGEEFEFVPLKPALAKSWFPSSGGMVFHRLVCDDRLSLNLI